jgi:tetratricopeptide (TPR) repeat protein
LDITAEGKEADSQHFAAQLGKASALAAGGKIDDAVKLVNDVIAKADPDNQEIYARAYVALGNCYKAAGKPKDALLAFLEVDLLYPNSPEQHAEALANLAMLWAKVDKADRAAQARSQLQGKYPHSRWLTKPPSPPSG